MGYATAALKESAGSAAKTRAAKSSVSSNLRISEPNDTYEREADRVAEAVLSECPTPSGSLYRVKSAAEQDVLRSSGAPLEGGTRRLMESRIGFDFRNVRIHADARAAASARAIDAKAYTVGSNVVFASGKYSPHSSEGQKLLAHELVHVVQQGGPLDDTMVQRAALDPNRPVRQAASSAGEESTGGSIDLEVPTPAETEELRKQGVSLPTVSGSSTDPRQHSDYVERRVWAVGFGIYQKGPLVFCRGLDLPVEVPAEYFDGTVTSAEIASPAIFPSREEALAAVPVGPPRTGNGMPVTFYRASGGLVVPTTFSPFTTPRIVKSTEAAMRQLGKEVADELVVLFLTLVGGKILGRLAQIVDAEGTVLPLRSPRFRQPTEPAPRATEPAGPAPATEPAGPAPATEPAPPAPASQGGAPGEQLNLFPELTDSAPSRELIPQPSAQPAQAGRVPRHDIAEIKSVQSEKAGWTQINKRKYVEKIPDSGHEAVVTYDAEGNIRDKVRVSGGDEKVIFDDTIGKIPQDKMPSAKFGTKEFGDAIEDPIRELLEGVTGQKFIIKHPSATGADILPHQPALPMPHL